MMKLMIWSRALFLPLLVVCVACGTDRLEGRPAEEAAGAEAAAIIDSVVPISTALERFRSGIEEVPAGLRGGERSAAAILRELDRLLAASDTAGLQRLALDRAEFAYLYYESSPLARPPYELPPELTWFQMQQESRIGALRLLREFGGRGLGEAELVCPPAPVQQGDNRVLAGCRVRMGSEEMRLFGALVERGGVYKVVSYANDF